MTRRFVKRAAIAFALIAAALISSCSGGVSETDEAQTDATLPETSAETSNEAYSLIPAYEQELIRQFPLVSFSGPDGKSVERSDALGAHYWDFLYNFSYPALEFDFAFLRYADNIFNYSEYDEEILYDENSVSYVGNPDFFRAKEGDTINGGLTVTSAVTWVYYSSHVSDSANISRNSETDVNAVLPGIAFERTQVSFDGQIELEGLLLKSDCAFIPDPSTIEYLPTIPSSGEITNVRQFASVKSYYDPQNRFSVDYDGDIIYLKSESGSIKDDESVNALFADGSDCVRVKVVLDSLKLVNDVYDTTSTAVLVSAQRA